MAVHRLTKPEQHLPSFAPHRTFIKGKKKICYREEMVLPYVREM